MTVGLKVYNDQGTLQFDSDTPAYGFVGKGTIQTGDFSDGTQYSSWSIAYTDQLPTFDTIAMSCSTSPVYGGEIARADANEYYFQAGGGSHTITYYLFRSFAKLPDIGGVGFRSHTPSGQLSYSTAYRPLTIIAKHAVTNTYMNISEYRGLPAGRQYAFINYGTLQRDMGNGGGGGGGYDVPSFTFNAANAGARVSGDGYYLEELRGAGLAWSSPPNGGFLIADVTGL